MEDGGTQLSLENEKVLVSERNGEHRSAVLQIINKSASIFFTKVSTSYLYSPGGECEKGIVRWRDTKNLCTLFGREKIFKQM